VDEAYVFTSNPHKRNRNRVHTCWNAASDLELESCSIISNNGELCCPTLALFGVIIIIIIIIDISD